MSHQSKIDKLIEKYDDISTKVSRDYRAFAFIGVVWSFASAIIGVSQGIARLHDEDDFMFNRLSKKERRERIKRLENRKDELGYAMAWAKAYASDLPEFAIHGADIVDRLTQDTPLPPTDEQVLKMEAEAFDVDIETLRILDATERADQEVRRNALREFIQNDNVQLAAEIDQWLKVEVPADFVLSDLDALRVARKLEQKARDHADKEFIAGRREGSRRPSRMMERAGNFRLLLGLSDEAGAVVDEIQDYLDAAGPAMVDTTTDHTAAKEDVEEALEA